MVTLVSKKLLPIGSKKDITKYKPCLIWTQIGSMDSSQWTLSKHVAPLCAIKDHQFILRNTRSGLESTVVKGNRVATPGVIEKSTTIFGQKNSTVLHALCPIRKSRRPNGSPVQPNAGGYA